MAMNLDLSWLHLPDLHLPEFDFSALSGVHLTGLPLTETGSVLLALTYLVLKHFMADYVLQTPYQFKNKGRYGHPGGIIHASVHGLLTLPVFLILPPMDAGELGQIIAAEILVHYHTDYLKEKLVHHAELTHIEAEYWWLFGADQLVHHLTYLAIVTYLARGMLIA